VNRLFVRIYFPLALGIIATVALSAFLVFRVLPSRAEAYSRQRLQEFRNRIEAEAEPSPARVLAIADSMGMDARIVPINPGEPGFRPPMPGPGSIFLPGFAAERGFGIEVPILPPGHRLFGRSVIWIFIGILLTAEAIVLLFSLGPLRRRLGQFESATGRLGSGDFGVRVPVRADGDILDSMGATFNSMACRISDLVRSHQELLGSVAHEIRTPLARIRFALELLRESGSAPDARISAMEKDLSALDSLLGELLAYNRLSRAESVEPEDVDLARLASEAASAEGWNRPEVSFSLEGGASARADGKMLGRAVANLLRNAYFNAESRVVARTGSTDREAWIEICDDGPGFPPDLRDRLGKPFVKGAGSQGSGLGLATVERVAALHHARVTYATAPEGGACVRIALPRLEPRL
jgi:signal transduction histidine kinase